MLSPSSLLASQSGEILGVAREMAQAKAGCSQNACGVEDVLQLLRILYIIGGDSASNTRTMQEGRKRQRFLGEPRWHRPQRFSLLADFEELQFNASPEEFTSKKITTKILQQIEVCFLTFLVGACSCPSATVTLFLPAGTFSAGQRSAA